MVVNGQIMPCEPTGRYPKADQYVPGDVDRFRFRPARGSGW